MIHSSQSTFGLVLRPLRPLLPLLTLAAAGLIAADAEAGATPALLQGMNVLETFKEEGMHTAGEPDDFIDARRPLRLKLFGMGKCKIDVAVMDKDAKDVLASETVELTLPTTYSAKMAIPNFGVKNTHYGVYAVRAVRIAPVSGSGCIGQTFTRKLSVKGASLYSVFRPLTTLTTRTLRIGADGAPGQNTLQFRATPALAGVHPPCPMTAMVQGAGGFSRTFRVPAVIPGELTDVPNVDAELAGITTGNYTFVLREESADATCRGTTVGPLAVEVVKPSLARVTPKQFHFESGQQQALTIEGSAPAEKAIRCDLEVRLTTRGVDSKDPPKVQTVKLDDAALPVTLTSTAVKGGGKFLTIVGDTLTHVVVKASDKCAGEVTTDFGVVAIPPGLTVVRDLPKTQGLKAMYTKTSTVSYQVIMPPSYTAQGIGCCQVETYRLDESNAWVKFKTLTGAATLEDLTTMYVTDTKPTLVRLRGYRNGVFTWWSDPTVITWP